MYCPTCTKSKLTKVNKKVWAAIEVITIEVMPLVLQSFHQFYDNTMGMFASSVSSFPVIVIRNSVVPRLCQFRQNQMGKHLVCYRVISASRGFPRKNVAYLFLALQDPSHSLSTAVCIDLVLCPDATLPERKRVWLQYDIPPDPV